MGIDQKLSKEARDLGWEEDSYGPCGGAVWFCYESVLMLVPLVCGRHTFVGCLLIYLQDVPEPHGAAVSTAAT